MGEYMGTAASDNVRQPEKSPQAGGRVHAQAQERTSARRCRTGGGPFGGSSAVVEPISRVSAADQGGCRNQRGLRLVCWLWKEGCRARHIFLQRIHHPWLAVLLPRPRGWRSARRRTERSSGRTRARQERACDLHTGALQQERVGWRRLHEEGPIVEAVGRRQPCNLHCGPTETSRGRHHRYQAVSERILWHLARGSTDCRGCRHPAVHESNLFDMNAKNGDVVPRTE